MGFFHMPPAHPTSQLPKEGRWTHWTLWILETLRILETLWDSLDSLDLLRPWDHAGLLFVGRGTPSGGCHAVGTAAGTCSGDLATPGPGLGGSMGASTVMLRQRYYTAVPCGTSLALLHPPKGREAAVFLHPVHFCALGLLGM